MLVFFIIIILVALALQLFSIRNANDHRNIRYECKPSVPSCEPGEEFTVFSSVSNLGRMPSPVIRIEEHFPYDLNVHESDQFNIKVLTDTHRIYRSVVVMRGRQQVRRFLRASIDKRGEYCFSFADFHAGDFLGFKEFDYKMPNDGRIVIYPRRLADSSFLNAFSSAMDDIALKKLLLEDPISVCGYRDYTGREPMRQISWKQSAVRNSLIVKQFDPVWQQSVCIALDAQYHGEFTNYYPEQELCFSIARTICEYLEEKRIGYRLITNAIITSGLSSFSSSGGKGGSFHKILYALGSAKNGCVCTVEELMTAVCSGTDRRRTIVFISTRRDADVDSALARTKALTDGQLLTLYAADLAAAGQGAASEGGATA
ncbi:MAG: DUF58 domain-containing protein [Clostridia bacterium]|nr:DUF58 domain-containing protein [Clostridia bacterium]